MKSIRTKALICLLILSVTLCSNLKREESETENGASSSLESMLKTFTEAETTAEGGSWAKGFHCPFIFLTPAGQSEQNQGAAMIQGKLFVDPNIPENKQGLILNFEKPLSQNTIFPQVASNVSGNKYFIPWRFVKGNFQYTNPMLSYKYIKGNLQNDQGISFDLKIVLPYKYIGHYISDSEGNQIRSRMNEEGRKVRTAIAVAKNNINTLYPAYNIHKENVLKIMKGVAGIDTEVARIKKNLLATIAGNTARKITRGRLARDAIRRHVVTMKIRSEMNKIVSGISNGNAHIKAISSSIVNLKLGKLNPAIQIAKANKVSAAAFKETLMKFAEIDKVAVDKRATIGLAQKEWRYMKGNGAVYKKLLASIAPN